MSDLQREKTHIVLVCWQQYNHACHPETISPALATMTLNDPHDANEWSPHSRASAHMLTLS